MPLNRDEFQAQIADAVEDAVQGGLIHFPADNCFTFGERGDIQAFEPAQPAFVEVTFDADLVDERFRARIHKSILDTLFDSQYIFAAEEQSEQDE
jgi:hypothetical protein